MLTTIMLPILWCIIISIIFGTKLLNYNQLSAVNIVVEQTLIDNIFTSQDLVLSLIGLAISVWIGLNIYNALSKEELKDLLDKAEHATKITERIYTEVLLSKFRMSPADRTVSYLASRLETIDLLPAEILENLIAVEDLFSFSYGLYEGGMASPYNHEGIDKIRTFMDEANEFKCEKKITSEQYALIMGHLSLRLADFSYFAAQYSDSTEEEKRSCAQAAIQGYKNSVSFLFNIRDITVCDHPDIYLPEERQSLAFLANNIGSAYLLFISPLSESQKAALIAVEKVAIAFSNEVPPNAIAVFKRNLGASYERVNQMDKAYIEYCESFQLDRKNWKTAHCLGAWYRKQIYARFSEIPKNLQLSEDLISSLQDFEKTEIVKLLKQSAYWYELKKINKNGEPESWLITIYRCIYQLTKDTEYREKADGLEMEKNYFDAVCSQTR